MNNFGIRLKAAMEIRKMSASELSKQSGVGKNLISYYIHGKYLAKQDKVYLLAKALDVDPGWLMTGKKQKSEEEKIPIVVPDSDQFVKIARAMSPEDFDTVMAIFDKTHKMLREKGEI